MLQYELYNGDCFEYMKTMNDCSVDLVLTDPPYNVAQFSTGNINLSNRKSLNNDIADWDKNDLDIKQLIQQIARIIKKDGNVFIFTGYNLIGDYRNELEKYFDVTNIFVWHKTNPSPKIYKTGFLNSCEFVMVAYNKKHQFNFTSQNEMHNFYESSICMAPERLRYPSHPTQKPIELLQHLMKIGSNEDDVVFDPFMGVGSTGVACKNLNRRFIGCELNETYYEACKNRLSLDNNLISKIINDGYRKFDFEV